MTCDEAKELMAASWLGELDGEAAPDFQRHIETCAECGAELASLGRLWERLGDMPAPEPSQAMHVRWQSTLASLMPERRQPVLSPLWPPQREFCSRNEAAAAITAGIPRGGSPLSGPLWPPQREFCSRNEAAAAITAGIPRGGSPLSGWFRRPVWQAAIALACTLAGILIGVNLPRGNNSEIAKLREEVASTREMVALSLLQQQSATERLRGVDYTGRLQTMEPEVVSALVQAVSHDANVNVRLAAIDALTKVASHRDVVDSLTRSLPRQESPMVQAALIDYLVQAHDRQAVGALRQLAAQPDLNPAVLERTHFALQQLSQ